MSTSSFPTTATSSFTRPSSSFLSSSRVLIRGLAGVRSERGGTSQTGKKVRRKRTSLGMVSDRPFRGPEMEALAQVGFAELGLVDDLVVSMEEFGE